MISKQSHNFFIVACFIYLNLMLELLLKFPPYQALNIINLQGNKVACWI